MVLCVSIWVWVCICVRGMWYVICDMCVLCDMYVICGLCSGGRFVKNLRFLCVVWVCVCVRELLLFLFFLFLFFCSNATILNFIACHMIHWHIWSSSLSSSSFYIAVLMIYTYISTWYCWRASYKQSGWDTSLTQTNRLSK